LAVPRLPPEHLRSHGVMPALKGTLAVVGPGTGLGVAGLMETDAGWQALPCEGGHATLAATNDFESTVLALARREFEHVSAERLLSGLGLPVLHRAVAAVSGQPVEVSGSPSAEVIVERGVDGSDAVCAQTLDLFCAMLGSFAGNVALTLGARGGLYVGGGIVPRMAELFFASTFRERFEAKGRYRRYLEAIPTALILDPHAALTGAALAIEQALGHPA
ncbi:MAG: glucokinase, partial [Burkholderiaceae bacterium]|nr:glucokinase [Burkholderiaceae bacterium]